MGVILNTAKNLARDGVLSTREIGELVSKSLEDGKLSRSEAADLRKVQNDLYNELTPEARRAISNFLSLGSSFEPNLAGQIFGVSDQVGDQLEAQGIRTAAALLAETRTDTDRKNLATAAGLDKALVTTLAEHADLARTVGVGMKYAAVLNKIGINDVQELATQNGVALRRQITSFLNTTEGRTITSRRPSLASVKSWIENAKTLPRMLRHVGDAGADFNKDVFDGLNNTQKHLLLQGIDVRLGDGFLLDADQLDISVVRRRTSGLKDSMDLLESTNFNATYESVEAQNVERIKVGDDVLGYRATYEVTLTVGGDSELAIAADSEAGGSLSVIDVAGPPDTEGGLPAMRLRGTVDVTFDEDGKILGTNELLDYDFFNHE